MHESYYSVTVFLACVIEQSQPLAFNATTLDISDVTQCDVIRFTLVTSHTTFVTSTEYVRALIGRFDGHVGNKGALVNAISNLQATLLR